MEDLYEVRNVAVSIRRSPNEVYCSKAAEYVFRPGPRRAELGEGRAQDPVGRGPISIRAPRDSADCT
jgi:hypothetical protein